MMLRIFYKSWFTLFGIRCFFFGMCVADIWFGSNQQYLCRCTDNKCLPDGTCADGARCLSEWFGPSCQYQNLATVYTAKVQPDNSLISVTDDIQCNINSGNTYMEVTWNISYPFTFLWLRFTAVVNKDSLKFTLLMNDFNVEQMQVLKISNTTIEIRSPKISTINRIKIGGDIFQNVCSIYISGGRNIALKQSSSQDSYYNITTHNATNAVDGNRDTDWYSGTCVHSIDMIGDHYWMVQFDREYLVSRYVLYSRLDKPPNSGCCIYRLQHFRLVSWDNYGLAVLNYTENGNVPQLTDTVTSDKVKVSKVTVVITNNVLNFCEFEAYGDSLCPPGKFGLECNKECRCRNDEPCFTDTGTCSSGCAAGYTGMGCQTPCIRGTWGVDCSVTCSNNCLDMTSCESSTGACVGGCVTGFKTPNCEQACDPGTWGINCSMSCSSHCAGDKSCDPVNGTCYSSCGDGYTGAQCDQEVYSIEHDESRGIGIGIGVGVVITSTVFLIVLAILYRLGILTLSRKLRNGKNRTLTEPETKYQIEPSNAYDIVTDNEATGNRQAQVQRNSDVKENVNTYDVINLDDVGKQDSSYCTIKT
ncbi:uncharacterized protein LOC131956421 [Physella acuta]|uniref:uncharacterized protein LOC131956421 n=1 Tax=Physella acuta TaxID=109671 RepID=UPI0027DDD271|nr:uncharacterized protein LOC131956421 [Physella acuta]